jgi:hypothetical protein
LSSAAFTTCNRSARSSCTIGEILAELRELRAELRQRLPESADARREALLAEIRRATRDPRDNHPLRFTVAELLEHAEVDPVLRAAIVAAIGVLNGKRLGQRAIVTTNKIKFTGPPPPTLARNKARTRRPG